MLRKNCLFLVVSFLLITACNSKSSSGKFTVHVTYKNALHPAFIGQAPLPVSKVTKVQMSQIPFGLDNSPVAMDSAKLTGDNGKIELTGTGKEEALYQLVFDNGLVVLVSNDAANIDLSVDLSKKDDYYTVTGSEASQQMRDFTSAYTEKSAKVDRAFAEMDSLKHFKADDSLIMAATNEKNNQIRQINDFIKEFVGKTNHPSVALFILGWASRSFTHGDFETALSQVVNKFPTNASVLDLKKSYDLQQSQMAEMQRRQKEYEAKASLWVGKMAPDLALPDANGQIKKISSFRGKYLLVDFWASWCMPCRQENPNVVTAYNEFKGKNFTILGVSLDKEKGEWIQAINDDGLAWTHVSDLKYWNSKAVDIYKFDGIPYNILIDPTGKVIAESLRGPQLEAKLKEVLQ
jgi:peroxiredoxin